MRRTEFKNGHITGPSKKTKKLLKFYKKFNEAVELRKKEKPKTILRKSVKTLPR